MNVNGVSVLICTYNRAALLREMLAATQALTPPAHCDVEILVVNNNSTDDTAAVIAEARDHGPFRVVGIDETRQGKGFALNTGFARASGDVIALTDDDVLPSADWLARIVDDFRERDVTFVFGKVLPRWSCLPPPHLLTVEAQHIWGPLAIVDYGDAPMEYLPESTNQRLPVGANLAFSRAAIEAIGGWRSDLGKVDNTLLSGEDHEIFMRLGRFDLYRGYYDPAVTVLHYVPAERLTRRYFRRWFYWHGKTKARMLPELYPELDMSRVPRVGGVPRFLFRQAAQQAGRWISRLGSHDALSLLSEELHTLEYAGLFAQCWAMRHIPLTASLEQSGPPMDRRSRTNGPGLAPDAVRPSSERRKGKTIPQMSSR
jgi:glycosyltransferase involved in cell wall biosynthesis